jgi:hypothetical protein
VGERGEADGRPVEQASGHRRREAAAGRQRACSRGVYLARHTLRKRSGPLIPPRGRFSLRHDAYREMRVASLRRYIESDPRSRRPVLSRRGRISRRGRLLLGRLEPPRQQRLDLVVLDLVLGLDPVGRVEGRRVGEADGARLGDGKGNDCLRREVARRGAGRAALGVKRL